MTVYQRSPNDLGRIAANEIAGIEPRGSMELIISTARGDTAPANTAYKIYVTGLECGRTDTATTSVRVALNDSATTTIIIPGAAGGGMVSFRFDNPLVVAVDTALTGTMSSATTSIYCSAQGFVAN